MLDMIRSVIRDHFIEERSDPTWLSQIKEFRRTGRKERKLTVGDLEIIIGMDCWGDWILDSAWDPLEEETEEEYHQRVAELQEVERQLNDYAERLNIRKMVKEEKKGKKVVWEEWFDGFYSRRWPSETKEEYKIRMEQAREKVRKYKKWKEEEEEIEQLPWRQRREKRNQEFQRELDLSGAKYEKKPRFRMPESDDSQQAVIPYERPKPSQSTVEIVEIEEKTFYGVWKKSSKKTIRTDRAKLYKKYYKDLKRVKYPYIVLVQNYSKKKEFELFMDVEWEDRSDLDEIILPAGEYARMVIEPKLVFLWGILVKVEFIKNFLWNLAIKEARNYFYKKWVPNSSYRALNIDYELYKSESAVLRPLLYIIYVIEKKE